MAEQQASSPFLSEAGSDTGLLSPPVDGGSGGGEGGAGGGRRSAESARGHSAGSRASGDGQPSRSSLSDPRLVRLPSEFVGFSRVQGGRRLYWGSPYPPRFDPAEVWGLTARQQAERLEHFRLNLEQRGITEPKTFGMPDKPDIHLLLRFLKARKYDIELATEMFVNSKAWRESFGVEEVFHNFQYDEKDRFIEFYPQGYHKTDKMGRPIYIQQVGKINMRELKKLTSEERMLKFHVQEYERLVRRIMPICSALQNKNIDQTFAIMDVSGVGLSSFTSDVRNLLGQITAIDQNNYPEMMGHMCIINAPLAFRGIWRLVKPMLDQRTQEKIEVCPGNYMPSLLKWIDIENIPEFLGGNSKGSLLDDVGSWRDPDVLREVEDRFETNDMELPPYADTSSDLGTKTPPNMIRGLGSLKEEELDTFFSPRTASECGSFFSFKVDDDEVSQSSWAEVNSLSDAATMAHTSPVRDISVSTHPEASAPSQNLIDRAAKLEGQVARVATRLRPYMPRSYVQHQSSAPTGSLMQRVDVLEDAMMMLLLAQEQEYVQKGRSIQQKHRSTCCCCVM